MDLLPDLSANSKQTGKQNETDENKSNNNENGKNLETSSQVKEVKDGVKEIVDKVKEIKLEIKETQVEKKDTGNEKKLNGLNNLEEKVPNEEMKMLEEMFPFKGINISENMTLDEIEKNKRILLADLKKSLSEDELKNMNCFSMKDINIDAPDYVNEKVENVGFDSKEKYQDMVNSWKSKHEYKPYYMDGKAPDGKDFDFDYQPDLQDHPGPSPSVILQVSALLLAAFAMKIVMLNLSQLCHAM